MQPALTVTALLMGLTGGPHCIAMCGAACAGIGQAAGVHKNSAMWSFQSGRVLGYSALGALAAASIEGLGWLTVQLAAMRPVWTLFHVATMMLGLLLLWQAQQPVWLERAGKKIWTGARSLAAGHGRGTPLVIGLLYSALLVAALTGRVLEGALVMALFAVGTSVSMMIGPWVWLRLHGNGDWGVRLAGLALAASSAWVLWMGLVHNGAPWCVTL